MNVILTTLNSRYTHMSLSLRYLRAALAQRFGLKKDFFADGDPSPYPGPVFSGYASPNGTPLNLRLMEFTINQPHEHMLRALFEARPDYLCFSVYIWNIEATLKLASSLKKVLPETVILFGGPETAFNAQVDLGRYPFVDAIVTGEGEEVLCDYLERQLLDNGRPIPGLTERTDNGILDHGRAPWICDLDRIPFPYEEEDFEAGRMLYYEASRGCPYRCAYCLSSREPGVRVFSLERVKSDLSRFLKAKVMQVKFVDRTFNVDSERTQALFRYLMEHDNGITGFHFEITAALLREADYEILTSARPGLFQFEIGVQSTCEDTMMAVRRPLPFDRTAAACRRLKAPGNLHLHLDLIAGLPFETYERFLQSFDEVFELRPHALQLGFLKLIPGSPLSEESGKYGYIQEAHPPYEVLGNRYISFDQLARLKRVEALVDIYYNSGGFTQTLEYALKVSGARPSAFFLEFAEFIRHQGFDRQAYRSEAHYGHLEAFLQTRSWYEPAFAALLDYDCLTTLAKRRRESLGPEVLETDTVRALVHDALREADQTASVKAMLKRIRYQLFEMDLASWLLEGTFPPSEPGALWIGWVDTTCRSAVNGHYPYFQRRLR